MPTDSAENYLKAVYHLLRGHRTVKTKALADALGVSLPSATSMLKSLASAGLVEYAPYQGATLTSAGERAALAVIRKHRLIETFLVETLGYTWDEVHDEAERLEHAVSDGLANRIEAYLGHPRVDPHGDPIPTADGEVNHRAGVPLVQFEPGRAARVIRVLDQDPEVLRYLDTLALRPDETVTVLEILPFDGPVLIESRAGRPTISRSLARRVIVDSEAP